MNCTDKGRQLGLETEVMLIDKWGYIANRAAEIVSHHTNTGNIVPEFCLATVEANPPPSTNIHELETNLYAELITIHSIANSIGINEVPLSEIGPSNETQRNFDCRRYVLFEEIMGSNHCNMERSFCATHLHVDHKSDIVGQYNLLQSMDPVFALMSTTSCLRGRNSINCGRVDSFRNVLFQEAPCLNQLSNYISEEADLAHLERARSEYFLSKIEPTEENIEIFSGYNNGSTPLRKTNNTIEIRCADSNFPKLALAMAALYKGVLERVFEFGSLEILISAIDSEWNISNSKIILPSYQTLKRMESEGIVMGARSSIVNRYLNYLISIAESGLPCSEVKFLQPFKDILQYKRNVADLLSCKAKLIAPTNWTDISIQLSALLNQFVAKNYHDALTGGTQLIDMIKYGVE